MNTSTLVVKFFIMMLYLFVDLSLNDFPFISVGGGIHRPQHTWRSRFPFYPVVPELILRLGSNHLYPLSHLAPNLVLR